MSFDNGANGDWRKTSLVGARKKQKEMIVKREDMWNRMSLIKVVLIPKSLEVKKQIHLW